MIIYTIPVNKICTIIMEWCCGNVSAAYDLQVKYSSSLE